MHIDSNRNIVYQTILWGLGWFIVLLIVNESDEFDWYFWKRVLLLVSGASIVVYINLKYLLPQLYLRDKKALYSLMTGLLLSIIIFCQHSDTLPWNKKELIKKEALKDIETDIESQRQDNDNSMYWFFRNLPPLLISLLGSSFASLSMVSREREKRLAILEKNNLETEIKFLKSQVNPHFLFNTLHNIYALTILDSNLASDKLLKLSNILRYMLYDSNQAKVPLKREIENLQDYLELAKLKDSTSKDIKLDLYIEDDGYEVAPLLFIPFVENAFKHSHIYDINNGNIQIELKTLNGKVQFVVENSIPKLSLKKDSVGGIGLSNIKQRLDLLYPNKYHLDIFQTDQTFKIKLEIFNS